MGNVARTAAIADIRKALGTLDRWTRCLDEDDARYAFWERQVHPHGEPSTWTIHKFPDGSKICMHCGQMFPCREAMTVAGCRFEVDPADPTRFAVIHLGAETIIERVAGKTYRVRTCRHCGLARGTTPPRADEASR